MKISDKRRAGVGAALSAPLAVIAYLCKYVLPGYSFTALVCVGIIGVILFYCFVPMLNPYFPRLTSVLLRCVTVVLVLGLAAAAVTEGFIIHAAFGSPKASVNYLIVLGAKVRPEGPSLTLWDRIYAARDYLEAHPEAIAIVSGGKGSDEVISEAQSMYNELTKLGISPERVWMEDRATSTDENLRYSIAIIRQRTGSEPDSLAVVSSEYHLFRAGLMVKKLGYAFFGVPARTSRFSQLINHGMREVAAVWHFFIFGR